MSKARDIANLFSSNTAASTDAEVTAAIAAHNNATSSVHGISNTASLATQDFVLLNKGVPSGTTAQRPVNFLSSTGDVYSNTSTGYMEIYNSTYGWEKVGANPSNLTVTPTNVGTGRAFNNGAVEVDLGFPAVPGRTYTITSTPTTTTYTANTAYAIFDGLQSSTQYTFTATATNLYGSSTPVTSSPVTVTTVPDAPTIGTAVAGNNTVTVSWTPGATGGSAITGYSVYPLINGVPQNPTTVPNQTSAGISVTNGTAYTFKVAAINANGMSQLSSASNSATPLSSITVDYFVLAGGGGGAGYGGGGGAGGLRSTVGKTGKNATLETALSIASGTTCTITVGSGAGGTAYGSGSLGPNGGNSSISGSGFTTVTSNGGGAGSPKDMAAGNGGCGGGGNGGWSSANGTGTTGQGFDGGTAVGNSPYAGGGGGGIGGAGAASTGSATGHGGVGLQITDWATPTSTGVDGGYYGGGGGGGGDRSGSAGNGGLGGGGLGVQGTGTAGNGVANTGGGGGAVQAGGTIGSGGSGLVLLRFNGTYTAAATTGSPTRVTSGGYTYYKFTGNGSITI